MLFDKAPRVRYSSNPLIEVVAQFSYAPSLFDFSKVTESAMALVKAELISDYPELIHEQRNSVQVEIPFGANVPQGSTPKEVKFPASSVFHFMGASENRVVVSHESIVFVASKYESWDIFFNHIKKFMTSFFKHVTEEISFNRVGLRYVDVIERSKIGLKGEDWLGLINEKVVPPSITAKEITGFNSVLTFLQEDINVTANLGLVTNAGTQEVAFMIDCDFYYDGITDYATSCNKLVAFNAEARNVFRGCITDKLHNALGPRSV